MIIYKIGGNELDDPDFLTALAGIIAASQEPVILVHGGGQAIANLQNRLGLEPVKVDGLRVTDAPSLAVAEMVLSGHANKLIVKALLAAGVTAVGLSGIDGGLLRARKKPHPAVDLGLVGEIVAVHAPILQTLLDAGLTPVISPISLGVDGQTYNVNADEAATAVARAMSASLLSFITNAPGVLGPDGLFPELTVGESEELINAGIIHSGMIPKVRAALSAIDQGVTRAQIVNLRGLQHGGGTIFSR